MEQILAFGLGIMLVTTIVLVYVILKSGKQVSKCVEDLREFERGFDNFQRDLSDREQEFYRNVDEVNRRIDSRVDKLNDVISREIEEANRKIEFLRRSLGKEY
jgi:biopolymer transport protein ExbB/TolQ